MGFFFVAFSYSLEQRFIFLVFIISARSSACTTDYAKHTRDEKCKKAYTEACEKCTYDACGGKGYAQKEKGCNYSSRNAHNEKSETFTDACATGFAARKREKDNCRIYNTYAQKHPVERGSRSNYCKVAQKCRSNAKDYTDGNAEDGAGVVSFTTTI